MAQTKIDKWGVKAEPGHIKTFPFKIKAFLCIPDKDTHLDGWLGAWMDGWMETAGMRHFTMPGNWKKPTPQVQHSKGIDFVLHPYESYQGVIHLSFVQFNMYFYILFLNSLPLL